MVPYELIAKKRDGGRHSEGEIKFLVETFLAGRTTDVQMSAWLMAVYLRGLDVGETAELTWAIVESGEIVDLTEVNGPKIDKHSTGGVGDKVTLVAAPLAASVGVRVPKLSGRALGHTGGTLDKLESIPGFRTNLGRRELIRQLDRVGLVVCAQTMELAPADKKLYALRHQTATVASIPLIVASIIGKKAAGGAEKIVIDVKAGSGAFMRSLSEAGQLAQSLTIVGERLGLEITCLISAMDQPLGQAIGNALEVDEAIDCLAGGGPGDLRELSVEVAARMALMGGLAPGLPEARQKIEKALDSGAALTKFKEFIEAQGGDPGVLVDRARLPRAGNQQVFEARSSGYLKVNDCAGLGMAAALLGGGHSGGQTKPDLSAGLIMRAKYGEQVSAGQPLVELLFNDDACLEDARCLVEAALSISPEQPQVGPLIYEE